MPVSLYGQCADLDEINAIAEKNGLYVIEDAAQSLGATYKGRQSCGLSDIGCTSFFPSKPLGAYGDGGACFTDNDDLAQAMREIRVHGQSRRYHHPRIGINGRLDTVQAAVLLSKLDIFDEEIRLRSEVGDRYANLLARDCHGVVAPFVEQENTSVYAQYTIQVENRDDVQSAMKKYDVPTTVHYPVPLNIQPALLDTRGSLASIFEPIRSAESSFCIGSEYLDIRRNRSLVLGWNYVAVFLKLKHSFCYRILHKLCMEMRIVPSYSDRKI